MTAALSRPTGGHMPPQSPILTLSASSLDRARELHTRLTCNALAVAILRDDRVSIQGVPRTAPVPPQTAPPGSPIAADLAAAELQRHYLQMRVNKAAETVALYDEPPRPGDEGYTEFASVIAQHARDEKKLAQARTRVTTLTAELAQIRTHTSRAGHPNRYVVKVPAVEYHHSETRQLMAMAELWLFDVQVEATPDMLRYRGNDTFEGQEYRGGLWPLWVPHKRDGLQLASGAEPWQHDMMRAAIDASGVTPWVAIREVGAVV